MAITHVSVSYHDTPIDQLDTFALGVKGGVYTNDPPFTVADLPMNEAAFNTLITTFGTKRAEYVQGGLAQKGPFLDAKNALMTGLDTMGNFVNLKANGNPNIITLGGYVPTDIIRTPSVRPLAAAGVTVKRGALLEIITECPKIAGVKYYGCIITESGPLPSVVTLSESGKLIFVPDNSPVPPPSPGLQMTGMQADLTEQRIKHFPGLKHDFTYYVYYYLVNAAGVSPLSEPVSIICF